MPTKIRKVVWNLYAGFQTTSALQKQPVGRAHATVNSTYRRLQNSSAENAKRPQLIIATTSGVGRILESDILGIAAMNCNDGSVKGFVGYKYPTYACWKRQAVWKGSFNQVTTGGSFTETIFQTAFMP